MGKLLEGLENLGLGDLSNMEVLQDMDKDASHRKDQEKSESKQQEKTEEDYLFDKTYTCPVCDLEFKTKTVRTGKAKLEGVDMDLRPRYLGIDPLKYDVVVCPRCGYAAVTRFFASITYPQAKLIMAQISPKFVAPKEKGDTYSYDEAILRHRLALVSAMVKHSKISERAYICLKTAWLIRGKLAETTDENETKELIAQEQEFMQTAYSGFTEALSKENTPICGMDEMTVMLMLAELARKTGHKEDAARLVSKIIVSRGATERQKSKARDIKELLLQPEGQ